AVFQSNVPRRLRLHHGDRLLWIVLSRFWSGWRRCLHMVQPDTVLRWHRRTFAWHWTRKSRRLRRMQQSNPLWGAPRIHGELRKLGIAVAQSTVTRYLPRPRKPPSQTWRTFLTNHLAQTVAIDFFTVPTATFRVLFVLVILSHERRRVVHFAPHRGLDPAADAGSVSLGRGATIRAARSRRHLRKRLRRHDPRYGNGGSAHCAAIPLAKSLCGAADRFHSPRMFGPCGRVESTILAPDSSKLLCLLPALPNSPSTGQRRPGVESRGEAGTRAHCGDSSGSEDFTTDTSARQHSWPPTNLAPLSGRVSQSKLSRPKTAFLLADNLLTCTRRFGIQTRVASSLQGGLDPRSVFQLEGRGGRTKFSVMTGQIKAALRV